MFRIRLVAAAAIAGAVTLLSSGVAQAYPDPTITITVSDATLVGGNTFSYTADSGDLDCDWTITYGEAVNGSAKQTGSGTSTSGTYDTKAVDKTFKSPIKALCSYDNDVANASAIVTLLPKGGDTDADAALPNTGGSNLWIPVVGGVLVLGGLGLTVASRRRSSH